MLALTPVAVLMFRFNNPDALLVLLLVAGAYAMTRAVEVAGTRWLLLAATFVGLGFLTKMLQALLVVPAFALVYLIVAPTPLRRRILQLLGAGAALVASAGWWVAIVELVPASMRPYIGGSQTNSVLELVLGYNGLGRLTGEEVGSVGGGGWGEPGWSRLGGAEIGGQAAWLLPAALVLLAAGLWITRRTPRGDPARAALLLWGGWLVVTGAVFSLMQGIFHAYYTVALAPAIGALVGIGTTMLWRRREHVAARASLAATSTMTAAWSYVLLGRSSDFLPWLAPTVLLVGLLTAAALMLATVLARRLQAAVAGAAIVVALAGPAAYAVQTAATAHAGSIPTAGPSVAGGFGGPGGAGGPGGFDGPGADGRPMGGPGRGGAGGLLDGSTPGAEVTALLVADAQSYTWAAAAVGSNNASGYQLATGEPVMALGGFNGSDPAPTLERFQQYVAEGQIHYFIGGGRAGPGGGSDGGSNVSRQIATWVAETFSATTVDGVTLYDLSAGQGGARA